MSIRTILTVTQPEDGNEDLKRAAALCEAEEAHLSVLVMALSPAPPTGEFAAMVSDGWIRERQADQKRIAERCAAVTELLGTSAVSADVSSSYPEFAWADEIVGRRARYADLTLVGPSLLADDRLGGKALEGALFLSGQPVLVVPAGTAATLSPRRVMVAWDAGMEASRALHASLGLLREADEVRLALVDPIAGEDGHGDEPGADAAAYLARHGATVSVDRLASGGRPIATTLREHATDMAADLVVMGAYGHSRLRERIFGGTTRSMLEDSAVPLLIAH